MIRATTTIVTIRRYGISVSMVRRQLTLYLYPTGYLYFLFKRRDTDFIMNASDIVKKKQNTTLYKAYYRPTVFQSTTISTLNTVSSFINFVSSGVPITSTSYTSCTKTYYTYLCEPPFMTYEARQAVHSGWAGCSGRDKGELQWKATQPTPIYSFSTVYSSLVTPSTLAPSTIRVTSTVIMTAPSPTICSLHTQPQGTSFAAQCPSCSHVLGAPGSCCDQCS